MVFNEGGVKEEDMKKEAYKDIEKLRSTFNKQGGDKKTIGLSLIDELLFMGDTLSGLKKIIDEDGVVEKFEQGKQNFMREHPALKSYNTMIKNYQSMFKQLNDMLPDSSKTKDGEGLLKFIAESVK